MINRAALILKYKEPAVKWINEADPYEEDPGITMEAVNSDRTVYLIMDHDADNEDVLKEWIKRNFKMIFEHELEGWYTDEGLWPQKRTMKLFYQWFDVECHTVIEDTVGLPIEDDEI